MVEGEMSDRGKSLKSKLEHVLVAVERTEMKMAKRPFAVRSLLDEVAESVAEVQGVDFIRYEAEFEVQSGEYRCLE